MQVKMAILEMP